MEVKVGQTWREVDPRFQRMVKVVGFCASGKVIIETGGKKTKAKRDRFSGKRGGYELVSAD